jgi:hypothetical protein
VDIVLGSEASDNLDSADETSATSLGYAQDGQLGMRVHEEPEQ